MKNKFLIQEKPLALSLRDEDINIDRKAREIIKSHARLKNELENGLEKAEERGREMFLEVLEIADSLERILYQARLLPQEPSTEKLTGHVRTAALQLEQVLRRRDVVPFQSIGKPAAPELTEIVATEERDECLEDEVIEEIEKGYLFKGKLLRRAKVKIARKKETE
jgi:molecular chaperone GrpE